MSKSKDSTKTKFTTTIKQKYLDLKMADMEVSGYFDEYKDATTFWKTRFANLFPPTDAIFLVGSKVHRFTLIEKKAISRCEVPEKYISMMTTEKVLVFRCALL
ncbi:MAG: hypothetical protein WC568_03905 [Candidatus Methanoperedens sp.]